MPNYRGLNIPFVSFGAVTSDDLFAEKEQAIFDFYAASKDRYHQALDIGANIGVHSILMAQQGWKVRAFEPDGEHHFELQKNLLRNRIGGNCLCEGAAVSDHDGFETFVRVKGNTTGSHLKGDKQPYGELEEFKVPVVDCRPLFRWAEFAKIDCEGHEARLLLTVTPECKCEFMVEVGNTENAHKIYDHFWNTLKGDEYHMWAQKNNWEHVKYFSDMPTHHSHGALFIGRKEPFPT